MVLSVGLSVAFDTVKTEHGVRDRTFRTGRPDHFSPVVLRTWQAHVQRYDFHRFTEPFRVVSLQGKARPADVLDVGDVGGAALFGQAHAQGALGRNEDGAFVASTHHHRAVPPPPVAVDRVGSERAFHQAYRSVQLRVGHRGGDVEFRDVHVFGRRDVRGEVTRPQPEAGGVPEDLDGPPERRGPALLVALSQLGVVHRAEPLREVAVLSGAGALQGEHLQRCRRVHLDDRALVSFPREGVVCVLHAHLLQLGQQLFGVRFSAEHPAARGIGGESHLREDTFYPAGPPLVRDRERRVDADEDAAPVRAVALDRPRQIFRVRCEGVGDDAPPLVYYYQARDLLLRLARSPRQATAQKPHAHSSPAPATTRETSSQTSRHTVSSACSTITRTTGSVPLGLKRTRPSSPRLFSALETASTTASEAATAFAAPGSSTLTLIRVCGYFSIAAASSESGLPLRTITSRRASAVTTPSPVVTCSERITCPDCSPPMEAPSRPMASATCLSPTSVTS